MTSTPLVTDHADAPDETLLELLTTPAGRADPYPYYARLRTQAPVFHSSVGSWVLTRFADCQQVLRAPQFGKREEAGGRWTERPGRWAPEGTPEHAELQELTQFFGRRQSMLSLNPPDHTRLRGLVSRAFTPRTVEALRPGVTRLCDELLDGLVERAGGPEPVDIMTALAFPLPVAVIGELVGVPPADRPDFQQLVRANTALLEPTAAIEQLREARTARMTMEAYFENLIDQRRRRPTTDLLSELIAVSDGSDRLSGDEMVATVILLFAAGFETTTNLIGNGLLALLRHPDQLRGLRASVEGPGVLGRAVEELLRWDSPVQLDGRTVFDTVRIDGTRLEPGDRVMTLLGAANRDPARFTDPDRLDLERDEGPPMSFGGGIHYCLGASLARMEGQVCFGRLLQRFSSIELGSEDVSYRDTITLRGLADLPVELRAA